MEMTNSRKPLILGLLSAALFAGTGASVAADSRESLSAIIDREIAASSGGPLVGPAPDDEFLRRVSLDLTGAIPTSQESRGFFADASPDKRVKLIDRLLDSPEFARRMQEAWTVMLLERHEGKAISDESWNNYLRQTFAANKPWDALVRELINADSVDGAAHPAIRLFVDGTRSDPHQRTQDFARLFLGMNLQCAQCHDHPTISEYKQAHYYGLFAFLSPGKLVNDKQNRPHLIETVVQGKVDFVSVFIPDEKHALGPKLLDGDEVAIPPVVKGEEFARPPQDGLPGIPKFQPRKLLGEQLTGTIPGRRRFARNAVNRFWFLQLGRGIVHPLDLDHCGNPPSHPVLLDRLTDAFIASGYNVKEFVREICHSATYQRASQAADGIGTESIKPASYRVAVLRPLSPEQLARSLAGATGQRQLLDATTPPETVLAFKDYSNGRTELPGNWRDVMTVFAGAFGHPAGQAEVEFQPSVEHALFLANDRLVRDWLKPRPDSLAHRLAALKTSEAVDEAYLSLLTRLPVPKERELAQSLLDMSDDRTAALQDLCLAIVTSAEFRLNH